MLDQTFGQVYTKFKLHFYKQIFNRFEDREATLTTVESFCMEVIMALGEPTIAQFSHMMNLSTPNAAYKINSLVKKGYVERIQSTTDKREYRLRPTQKYIDYYNISYSYLHLVMERAKQRFSPDDLAKLEEMLQIVSDELMPEFIDEYLQTFTPGDFVLCSFLYQYCCKKPEEILPMVKHLYHYGVAGIGFKKKYSIRRCRRRCWILQTKMTFRFFSSARTSIMKISFTKLLTPYRPMTAICCTQRI